MERAHPERTCARTDQPFGALPHLTRRLVCERDGEEITGVRVTRPQKVRDTVGEDSCLAASRAGEYEQRSVAVLYGLSLLGIQLPIHYVHPRSARVSL